MLGFLVINHHSAVFVLCYCGVQFALGLTNTLQYSISADNVDTIRNELDIEATALIASLTSLIMKFAMAIGGAVPGFVLSFTGYAANQSQIKHCGKRDFIRDFRYPADFICSDDRCVQQWF